MLDKELIKTNVIFCETHLMTTITTIPYGLLKKLSHYSSVGCAWRSLAPFAGEGRGEVLRRFAFC